MTRLLVLSDSHGQLSYIDDVLRKHKNDYDILIHLGDQCSDMLTFLPSGSENQHSVSNFYLVRGNIENDIIFDNESNAQKAYKESVLLQIENFSVLLTHGHRFSLQSTSIFLHKMALKNGCDLVFHGHTHKRRNQVVDGIRYFNPGALVNREYAIITLDNKEIVKVEELNLLNKW